jgi:hydroxymethylpyrimidine kinase/phosphomethylpyrimidine kinase
MLSSAPMIDLVARSLREIKRPYVCDPVMVAKSGDPLLAGDAVAELRSRLLPLATVITPNRHEVRRLLNLDQAVNTIGEAKQAAEALHRLGPANVVIKAIEAHDGIVDVLFDGASFTLLEAERLPVGRSHGSGCAFSAAIAAELAKGRSVIEAVRTARKLITEAIRESFALCRGTRPINVLAWGRMSQTITPL